MAAGHSSILAQFECDSSIRWSMSSFSYSSWADELTSSVDVAKISGTSGKLAAKRLIKTMSGNTKDKIAIRNNAGKTTPAATAPMANAYTNATVLGKIENLVATFHHRKCNETSSRFLFLKHKEKR
ncbi:hypothetical protein F2Q69_00035106 [Brassica cretica]|uniref:Uncharacterized protein n=1 Tax=Brassica cretica TaxID=69181 RepID=A0A8S9SKK5_BRACR|nr:hypothetical protein F2Q69_00035106 [Brassica cretica]